VSHTDEEDYCDCANCGNADFLMDMLICDFCGEIVCEHCIDDTLSICSECEEDNQLQE
jgi:hypothetical protein